MMPRCWSFGETLQRANQCEVNDSGAGDALVGVGNVLQLFVVAPGLQDAQRKVGTIDALVKHLDLVRIQPELTDDILLDFWRRGGGQGDGRGLAQQLTNLGQASVVGPKVVSPM